VKVSKGIEGFRRGCGDGPCVHVEINAAMTPDEAVDLVKKLKRAIGYSLGWPAREKK
jgi:hypothetical protein